jgi:hypothetical protein
MYEKRLDVVDIDSGEREQAGLIEVCEWLVENYPEDIFTTEGGHPVSLMRDRAKEILCLVRLKRKLRGGAK